MIKYINNCKCHIFHCITVQCCTQTWFVHHFLDKANVKSTSNLRSHAKGCWGEEAVAAADGTRNVKLARMALQSCKSVNGSITSAFQRLGRGTVTYSHYQYTRLELQYVWVFKSSHIHLTNWCVAWCSSVGSRRVIDLSKLSTTPVSERLWKLGGLTVTYLRPRHCPVMSKTSLYAFTHALPRC